MHNPILTRAPIVLSLFLAACGSAAPTSDVAAAPVKITLETRPTTAAMGAVELVLTVTDGGGRPIEGARVDVSADHTDMTGMTMGGAATAQGAGKYAITADFSMSGNWVLTVYVRKDALEYKQDIPLVLQ